MKLSIIIVNYNVKHFLEQCLKSVEKAIEQLDAEIIVVDNNSVDGSLKMINHKFPKVVVIPNKTNTGFSVANNQTGKLAVSRFSIQTVYYLGENQKLSLIGCEIETGRTHQIRVHAKFIGCPIFGDDLYKSRIKQELNVEKTVLSFCNVQRFRQMLHSHELSITHPESGKRLFFRGDFPPDFSNILLKLDKYKTG